MYTYLFFLIFASIYIKKSSPEKIDKASLIISVILFILAFFQKVDNLSDLNLAFEYLDKLRNDGPSFFQQLDVRTSLYFLGRYSLQVYFYIISLLPWNNFFSSIAIFVIYFLSFKSVLRFYHANYINIDCAKMLLILLLLLIDFYDGSNGVRNMLSFSIFIYAIVWDLCFAKTKRELIFCFILYFIAAFLHSSAWILLAIRCILFLKRFSNPLFIGGLLLACSYATTNFAEMLAPYSDVPVVGAVLHGFDAYAFAESSSYNFDEAAFNTQSKYLMMSKFRLLFIFILLFFIYRNRKKSEQYSPILLYSIFLCFFALGTGLSEMATNVLTRYSYAIIFLAPIITAEISMREEWCIGTSFYRNIISYKMFLCLLVIILLFNYYMFGQHYYNLHFDFILY